MNPHLLTPRYAKNRWNYFWELQINKNETKIILKSKIYKTTAYRARRKAAIDAFLDFYRVDDLGFLS